MERTVAAFDVVVVLLDLLVKFIIVVDDDGIHFIENNGKFIKEIIHPFISIS